jgi:hypothetical protein
MRTPMGELAFAAHARHAQTEMRALAHDVLVRLADGEHLKTLERLLTPEARERNAHSRAAGGDPKRGADGGDERASACDEDERAEKASLKKDIAQPGEEDQL